MEKIKVLELFGGIGACTTALKRLNIEYEISDYVEIDKYAVASYNVINNTNFEPQDITKWDKNIYADLIMHGSPCQDFSSAGKQAGGDENSGTRSSLMYETIRIIEKIKPKYVIWENVKNLLSKKHKHNFDTYINRLEELGYNSYYKVLNAKDYGIPQNRERVYTISIRKDVDKGEFEFPTPEELTKKLKDMLEENIEERYYLSDKMKNYISANNEKWTGNNNKSLINKTIASAINTNEGQRRCDASNFISNQVGENYNLKNLLCDTLLEKNMVKESDVIRHDYTKSRMNNFYKQNSTNNNIAPTLDTGCDGLGVVTRYKEYNNFFIKPRGSDGKLINGNYNRIWKKDKYCGTINLTKIQEIGEKENTKLRIRKLTPKECWRLMGFTDEEFEKAEKVNSNAQLYKQAGNSIVVNVLEKILKNLLKEE